MKPTRARDSRVLPESAPSNSSIFLQLRNKLREAEACRQSGKLDAAQSICSKLIAQYPDYAAALHSLGLILSDRGQHLDALAFLNRAAMHNPDNWSTHTALGVAYLSLGATELAEQSLERARALSPNEAAIHVSLGELHREQQDHERAAEAFARANALDASLTAAHIGLAMALIHLGRLAEAAKALETSLKRAPANLNALLALAGLPGHLVELDLLSIISKLSAKPGTPRDSAKIAFAHAAALDQCGKHAEAWSGFIAANKMMFREMEPAWKNQREHDLWLVKHLRSSPTLPAPARSPQDEGPISLFIIGPSRSGKSTAELLISTMPGVKRGFESQIVEKSVRRSFQDAALPPQPRDHLNELPAGMDSSFRKHYLQSLRAAASGHRLLTITNPARMLDALRLATLLPSAGFVLVKRDPDDLMVRIFMKMFLKGHPYAYSLASIREYVQTYYAVQDVLAEKLPGRTYTIRYEDMIAEPQKTRDTIGAFCGLAPASEPIPDLGNDIGCAKLYPLS